MKTVTFHLDPITVQTEGKDQNEILENAKKEVLKQLASKFPRFSYSINEGNVLTIQTAKEGTIVEDNKGNIGIITNINQKTINVTFTGGRAVQGSPELFKKSEVTFEKARSKRQEFMKEMNEWSEGDTGYLKTKEGLEEVVVGKGRGKKTPLFIINGEGRHFKIDKNQFTLLQDEK